MVGTLNMLGLAKRIGAWFLLTNTSEVYGDPLEHPQKGEHLEPGFWLIWANVDA
jgi:UDP-glucuronate decarboxylase